MNKDGAQLTQHEALTGCLLGTAVGDALGLPREGMSAERAARLYGCELRYSLVFGRGLVSDDTEHAAMVALALITSSDSPRSFVRALARRLRWWFLSFQVCCGMATLRSCLRLCLGTSPERSGVFSAGNGPMMRSPIIGIVFAADLDRMREYVSASTQVTHTDPKADRAAFAVALAASHRLRHPGRTRSPESVVEELRDLLPEADDELQSLLTRALDPKPLDDEWERGPSGYAYHTLLAVLHSWLHHAHDFRETMQTILGLGGDADTTAAILGGILGGNLGQDAVPPDLLAGIIEWPRSVKWLRKLAQRLAESRTSDRPMKPPRYFTPGVLVRNLVMLLLVLAHGLYRFVRR